MDRILMVIGLSLLLVGLTGTATADTQPSSPNYNLPESYIGPGGSITSTSPNYKSSDTAGDLGTGVSGSNNYSSQSGFNTTPDPRLVLIVNSSTVGFGAFSTAATQTATATFSVLNYTSYGYNIYAIGSPPDNGSHTLAGMSSTASSATGIEQFGINLKANTSPATFGADPVQVPGSNFSSGTAASNYNTANSYRYVPGEQIAGAGRSSGETDYTISYIINVATDTPAGAYSGAQSLVAIGTY
jgi:hypothetical protein